MRRVVTTYDLIQGNQRFTIDQVLEGKELVLVDTSAFGYKKPGEINLPSRVYFANNISELNQETPKIERETAAYQWQRDNLAQSAAVQALEETKGELFFYLIHLMRNCNFHLRPGGKQQSQTTRSHSQKDRTVIEEFKRNWTLLRHIHSDDHRQPVKLLADLAVTVNDTIAALTSYAGPRMTLESTITTGVVDHALAGAVVAYVQNNPTGDVGVIANDQDIPRIIYAVAQQLPAVEGSTVLDRTSVFCYFPQKSYRLFAKISFSRIGKFFPNDRVTVLEPYHGRIAEGITIPEFHLRPKK